VITLNYAGRYNRIRANKKHLLYGLLDR